MAFNKYISLAVGTSPTTVHTVAAGNEVVIIGLNLANTSASQINVDVKIAGAYLVKGASIPVGSALSVLDGKLIMEAADTCVVTSNTAASCDVILSVLEQGET